jgi:hypothetical protein
VAAFIGSENTASTFVAADTPVAPSAGVTAVTVGAVVSIVHVEVAGVGSALPEALVDRTPNVCDPSASPA